MLIKSLQWLSKMRISYKWNFISIKQSTKLCEKFRTNRFTHMTSVFATERRNERSTVYPLRITKFYRYVRRSKFNLFLLILLRKNKILIHITFMDDQANVSFLRERKNCPSVLYETTLPKMKHLFIILRIVKYLLKIILIHKLRF